MRRVLIGVGAVLWCAPLFAQGTQADYDRALGLRKKYEALVGNAASRLASRLAPRASRTGD